LENNLTFKKKARTQHFQSPLFPFLGTPSRNSSACAQSSNQNIHRRIVCDGKGGDTMPFSTE
jgi:hypothetical protein